MNANRQHFHLLVLVSYLRIVHTGFSLWCHQMQSQCDCFLRAQTACSLSKELVLILQHKDPVKYQGQKEGTLWTLCFKHTMLLIVSYVLMFPHNLFDFLKNKTSPLSLSVFYYIAGTYY